MCKNHRPPHVAVGRKGTPSGVLVLYVQSANLFSSCHHYLAVIVVELLIHTGVRTCVLFHLYRWQPSPKSLCLHPTGL